MWYWIVLMWLHCRMEDLIEIPLIFLLVVDLWANFWLDLKTNTFETKQVTSNILRNSPYLDTLKYLQLSNSTTRTHIKVKPLTQVYFRSVVVFIYFCPQISRTLRQKWTLTASCFPPKWSCYCSHFPVCIITLFVICSQNVLSGIILILLCNSQSDVPEIVFSIKRLGPFKF